MAIYVVSAARQPQLPPRSTNSLVYNSSSTRRRQIEASQLFRFQELIGHTGSLGSMEFSDDGTLLISGGGDKTVRLWSINQGRDEWNSTEVETKHDGFVRCLAFSLDNQRIFSGGLNKKILIHDTQT